MVILYLQDYLNKNAIEKIRVKYGFRDSLAIEKFIMDFEILGHILQVLPDCIVKGGMAVPFHLEDESLRRLSVDIDVVTGCSREEAIDAMQKISDKLEGMVTIKDPHIPSKTRKKKLPLLTYYCHYISSIDEKPELKIEIFYGNKTQIKSKKIDSSITLIGFPIDFPLSIYDLGSLIGDKLTTLPFTTIGIDHAREIDVPKQIYDIANLLKISSDEPPTAEIIDVFEKISNDEIGYFIENKPSFNAVLKDLDVFSDSLLKIDNQIKLKDSYKGRYKKFTTDMLGKTPYPAYAHVADILLIKVFIKLLLKKFEDKQDILSISEKITEILKELKKISNFGESNKIRFVRQMRGKYSRNKVSAIIKNLTAEQAYLCDQMLEMGYDPV